MHKLRKFLTIWIAPVLSVILVLLKIESIENWLSENCIPPWAIGMFLALIIIVGHIITVVSPLKKYEKLEKNKWQLFGYLAQKLKEDYKNANSIDININVMIPKLKFFYRIEPNKKNSKKKKFSCTGKVFKIIWNSEQAYTNKRLRITVNQGVCGMAFRDGKLYAMDLTQGKIPEYNFTEEQYKLTNNLVFVISCPIFEMDSQYSGKISDKVIGVLNVESNTKESAGILEDNTKIQDIVRLSNVVNKIL